MSSNYDKNYSALRKIINDDETIYSRNYVKFHFHRGERYQEGRQLKGIYNVLTNNVIAMINPKGNVFFRASSIYAQHIKESSNKVILDTNMRRFKNYVGSHEKAMGRYNMMAEKASERLIENDDKPNKVFLFHWDASQRLDDRFIMKRIKEIVKPKDDSNTGYALAHGSLIGEEDTRNDRYKSYLVIEDFSDKIKLEARQLKAKKNIIGQLLTNLKDIVQNSIIAMGTLNPLQFTYRDEEGEITGWVHMRDLYLDLPSEINIRDYYSEEQLLGLVRFGDRLGSLAEQGVDEQEQRMEQERREREREQAILNQMVNMAPGGVISYSDYVRGRINVPQYRDATWVTREQVEAMAMPEVSGWEVPTPRVSIFDEETVETSPWDIPENILQDYPTNEREATSLVDPTPDTNSTMSSA